MDHDNPLMMEKEEYEIARPIINKIIAAKTNPI